MQSRSPLLRVFSGATYLLVISACAAGPDRAGVGADAGSGGPSGDVEGPSGASHGDGGAIPEATAPDGLSIEPGTAILVITERGAQVAGQFQAYLSAESAPLDNVQWRVSGDLVDVDAQGTVTTRGLAAGEVELSASYGNERATAKVYISVALRDVSTDVGPANLAALEGPAEPDPGLELAPPNPSKVLYPVDQTVMPRGISAPTLQLSPGSLPPEDVRIYISAEGFGWDGFLHVDTPLTPRLSIPQDVWDGAMASARAGAVAFEITKATSGSAYGPTTTHVIAADGALEDSVYE